MMDFIIDTVGDTQPETKGENEFLKALFSDFDDNLQENTESKKKNKSDIPLLDEILEDLKSNSKQKHKPSSTTESRQELKEVLKKSVLTPEFEKLHSVPPLDISQKKLREQRKREREKTKGKKWFGLPATELTEEVKNDLEILQMRSVLDPKHFYKKNDLKVLPKYFQIGKVMDSPLDFYNNRMTKKERKRTLVEELLADAQFNSYNKRKYKEIIEEKQKTHYKAWRQAKRLKKKK